MERLTLEHIAPYLPYGLKVQSTLAATFGDIVDVIGAVNETLQLDRSSYREDISDFEAILRPMDLTKPIIVEGKEIIAYHELCKIACNIQELPEDVSYNENNRQLEVIGKRGYKLIFAFDSSDNSFIIMSNGVTKCVSNQLSLFQWLFKHKFDVFGLIEKGLAIDVNTLTTNPYN